jgi:hypothetical protein
MKMILGAFALVIAAPVAGQSTQAADPHAGHHAQHQGMDHGQHSPGMHDCKECCEKMKGKGGKMECKDKTAEAKPAATEQDHGGHAH